MKLTNQITTPIDLFNWAKHNVDIKTFYVSSDEVINNQDLIKKKNGRGIASTRNAWILLLHFAKLISG
jgi:hypothetical protein